MADDSLQSLLDRAAARHGGWDRWRTLDAITLEVRSLRGLVPRGTGLGRTYPRMKACTLWPRRRRMVAHEYPWPGQDMVFDAGRVAYTGAGAEAIFEHGDHRSSFAGLAKLRRWSPADATYFFGYALTHYLSLPFSLAQARVVEHRRRPGHPLPDRVTVRYPPSSHTHGPTERLYFDDTGLLRRHDYHAEILGPGATGAHFSDDYVEVDGLMVARTRRVVARLGPWATPLTVLEARLEPQRVTSTELSEAP